MLFNIKLVLIKSDAHASGCESLKKRLIGKPSEKMGRKATGPSLSKVKAGQLGCQKQIF